MWDKWDYLGTAFWINFNIFKVVNCWSQNIVNIFSHVNSARRCIIVLFYQLYIHNYRTNSLKLDYCEGKQYHLIRAEVKEMHVNSQKTICSHLGTPRITKVGTPAAETSESFPSENIPVSFSLLQWKKGRR